MMVLEEEGWHTYTHVGGIQSIHSGNIITVNSVLFAYQ